MEAIYEVKYQFLMKIAEIVPYATFLKIPLTSIQTGIVIK